MVEAKASKKLEAVYVSTNNLTFFAGMAVAEHTNHGRSGGIPDFWGVQGCVACSSADALLLRPAESMTASGNAC